MIGQMKLIEFNLDKQMPASLESEKLRKRKYYSPQTADPKYLEFLNSLNKINKL